MKRGGYVLITVVLVLFLLLAVIETQAKTGDPTLTPSRTMRATQLPTHTPAPFTATAENPYPYPHPYPYPDCRTKTPTPSVTPYPTNLDIIDLQAHSGMTTIEKGIILLGVTVLVAAGVIIRRRLER